jgi:hypothetical protein
MDDTLRAQFLEYFNIYHNHTSSAEERSAADNWLTQFKERQEAWQVRGLVRAEGLRRTCLGILSMFYY